MSIRMQAVQQPGHVLVADDSRLVRAMIRLFLERAGLVVETATDGEEALQLLRSGRFDVVVTDLNMPHRDGFALMEAAGSFEHPPEMIVLTGTHSQDIRSAVRALRLGAHDFLTKPPESGDDVVMTVQRAVAKKRARDANAALVGELQRLSQTDELTGVGNRRAFDDALRAEQTRAGRYGLPLAVAMLDLDHFKGINDRLGHPAGDAILEHLPAIVLPLLRDGDGLYRYGGEEFAILLPHTDRDAALSVARRIVEQVAASPVRVAGVTVRVTCSAGVAAARGQAAASGMLVESADRALYAAKAQGRNRAVASALPARPDVVVPFVPERQAV